MQWEKSHTAVLITAVVFSTAIGMFFNNQTPEVVTVTQTKVVTVHQTIRVVPQSCKDAIAQIALLKQYESKVENASSAMITQLDHAYVAILQKDPNQVNKVASEVRAYANGYDETPVSLKAGYNTLNAYMNLCNKDLAG